MKRHNLLILDDVFPCKYSPFRYEEFTRILENIQGSYVVASGASLPLVGCNESIASITEQYYADHPGLTGRVLIDSLENVLRDGCLLAYAVFLNNIYSNIEILEEHQIPFVFTLYPGGGFAIKSEEANSKLKRVLQSPCFRKVIVNEEFTYDYLIKSGLCAKSEVVCIHGVVVPQEDIRQACISKKNKQDSLRISFCAYKYAPMGRDKGYDIFVNVAKLIHRYGIPCHFDVIGNFTENDVDVSEIKDSITFNGVVSGERLRDILSRTDIFLSPTRVDILEDGGFNGFPTTACVTAALCGALVMTTDEYHQNRMFTSGEDIEIISLDEQEIFERIVFYYNRKEHLYLVRQRQMEKFSALYDASVQISPRLEVLMDGIKWSRANPGIDMIYPRPKRIEIPIMHCFDNNYVIPAAASFYSMLKYASKNYDYRLFVLHSDITYQNQELLSNIVNRFPNATVEFINMQNRFDDIWKKICFSGHYSKEVLYKLLVASIFPQYDKILITDVDVIFRGDISESYFAFDAEEQVCFAGVHHVCPKGSFLEAYYEGYKDGFDKDVLSRLKVCGGYLVANLKYLRAKQKEEVFVEFLTKNAYRLRQSEQDVINFCCAESEIKYLPLANVVCTYMYDIFQNGKAIYEDPFFTSEEILIALKNPIQIHYATGIKPWKNPMSTKADLWIHDLVEAGAYFEFEQKLMCTQSLSPEYVNITTLGPGWKPNNSPVVVSILCCTYNHEKFIAKALESFVNQKVKFKYEIIVADDASTDQTRSIIEQYAAKYPDLFHCILRDKNIGIGPNYYDALQHVQGKFLAICDGDDYWTDMEKLQRQVDYMDSHPDCTVCCTSFVRHEYNGEDFNEVPFNVENYIKTEINSKEMYSFRDLLYCRFVASCTTMLRWQYKDRVPAFLQYYPVIDFPLILLHAAGGRIGVMHNYSPAVYNVHSNNLTSSNSSRDLQMLYNQLLCEIDQYLNYRFTSTITEYISWQKNPSIGVAKENTATETGAMTVSQDVTALSNNEAFALPLWKRLYRKYVPNSVKRIWKKVKAFPKRFFHQ